MLPLQAVDRVEPRLEALEREGFFERLRFGVFEGSRHLAQRIEEALRLVRQRFRLRGRARERAQRARGAAHRALGAPFLRGQGLPGRAERLEHPLPMPETLSFLFQGFLLAGQERRGRELRQVLPHLLLVRPVPFPGGAFFPQRAAFPGDRLALPRERGPLVREAGPGVEELGLALRVKQELMLVLAMKVHEKVAEAAQLGQEHGPAVHERPALPVARELPAQDDLPFLGLDPRLSKRFQQIVARLEIEDSFHEALRLSRAQPVGIGPLPEEERDGAQDDRFSRSGLSGEHVERRIERELDAVHEREPLNREPGEHAPQSLIRVRVDGPAQASFSRSTS